PPILISGVHVRGIPQPLAAVGQSTIAGLVFRPSQNQVQLDFVGLGFAPGELLRYQYRLEGAESDWSAPTEQRTINYASLSPGRYRFQVRAVNSEGAVSAEPATVDLRILRPVWQTWWFQASAGIVLALLAYALYRYRMAQLLAVERLR